MGLIDFTWWDARRRMGSGGAGFIIRMGQGLVYILYESLKAATNHCCPNWTTVMATLTKHESFVLKATETLQCTMKTKKSY